MSTKIRGERGDVLSLKTSSLGDALKSVHTTSRDHFASGSTGNAPKLNTALRHKNDILESQSLKKNADTLNHIDFPEISCVKLDNQPIPPNKTNSRNMHVIKERSA